MAIRVISDIFSLVRNRPLLFASLLLFFTPPLFPVVVFFSPLIVSTALCVLALVSIRAHFGASAGELDSVDAKAAKLLDGLGSSIIEEKAGEVVRMSREEVTWLEWMEGHDGNMRDIFEKRPLMEGHAGQSKQLLDKQSLSVLWETISANNNETACAHTLHEEHNRPTVCDKSICNSSVREDVRKSEQIVKEDEGEAGSTVIEEEGSSLRFSFFNQNDNDLVLAWSEDGDDGQLKSINPVLMTDKSAEYKSLERVQELKE